MSRVQIRDNYFIKDGKPFFYQGDTLWMAFSKMQPAEWRELLRARRAQRFTVAQISVLPITHDNAASEQDLHPFFLGADGRYDFDRINTAYFDRAVELLAETVKQDIVPCLHLLWVDYVPGTWGAHLNDEHAMTPEQAERFLRYIIPRFEPYEPIYSVTGDTAFESETVTAFYERAIALLRTLAPEALLTMHLTPKAYPPASLSVDFHSYQAGHNAHEQDNNFRFAAQFYARGDGKPIVNSEPPYEAHGAIGGARRFTAYDIRRAFWQSLLSGASAGVGYGAHGTWMMYRDNLPFSNVQISGKPYEWRTALHLDGAWEGAFAQQLYEHYQLFGMRPLTCLRDMPPEVCAATNAAGTILIYAPFGCDVTTTLPTSAYECNAFDMTSKRYMRPEIAEGEQLTLLMPPCMGDVLYILTPKSKA